MLYVTFAYISLAKENLTGKPNVKVEKYNPPHRFCQQIGNITVYHNMVYFLIDYTPYRSCYFDV